MWQVSLLLFLLIVTTFWGLVFFLIGLQCVKEVSLFAFYVLGNGSISQ